MKKIILLLLILNSFKFPLFAQVSNWLWAKQATGSITASDGQEGTEAVADAYGNVYVVGRFSGNNIKFGSITLVNTSPAYFDIFIVKYDPNGNVMWAKNAGGSEDDIGNSISIDASGNLYITGYFNSNTIALGSFSLTNTHAGTNDLFIAKYDISGNVLWAESVGGYYDENGFCVTKDAFGNIYLAGRWSSATLTIGSTTITNSGPTATFDIILIKYDPSGGIIWAKDIGGDLNDEATNVVLDASGNLILTGMFNSSSIDFGGITLINPTSSKYNTFIVKYDNNINLLWAKRPGTVNTTAFYFTRLNCAIDLYDEIYLAGSFTSPTITFDTITLTNEDYTGFRSDVFFAKYDSNGNAKWAKRAGGHSDDYGEGVATDASGVYFIGGFLESPSNLITLGIDTLPFPGNLSDPIVLVKYDFNGNKICLSTLYSGGDDQASIIPDGFGNVYIAGDFFGIPTFEIGIDTLTLYGQETFFIAKYNCSTISTVNINETPLLQDIAIYPNPNDGTMNLIYSLDGASKGEIVLYDLTGKLIVKYNLQAGKNNQLLIQDKQLNNGVYFYKVIVDNEVKASDKIIIVK
ncbi:MAG: type sorting protein [Bacteroidetes bacterium]|nr:type sorting protein [Bacteroidota bacterium]